MKLILASASERRKELLSRLTDDFDIVVSNFEEEKIPFNGDCAEYVMTLAEGKALSVKAVLKESSIIIASDTVVYFNNKILGKPQDEKEALQMLQSLSGSTHEVYSGIAIMDTLSGKVIKDFERTEVRFSDITLEEILKYIKSGEPMDKAGAYGIQGYGGVFVETIQGCFYNVVGLPLNKLKRMLGDVGVNL